MSRESNLQRILDGGLIAVVRTQDSHHLIPALRAIAEGGVDVAEITFTVPGALELIAATKRELGQKVLVGAGTVLDSESARAAILAGAEFVVSPTFDPAVVALAKRYGKLAFPGAFTPTEILAAWEAGADIVKVFPAECLGPAFFKAMRGPLPQIRLMTSGGVDLKSASEFLRAGASCLGVGSNLVDPKAIARQDDEYLKGLAFQYRQAVLMSRAG